MTRFTSLSRPLLRLLALLFAVATVLYGSLWMYYIRLKPQSMLGVEFSPTRGADHLLITRVVEGSGAAAAGVRSGDLVRAIDGRTFPPLGSLWETVIRGRPGDIVRLTIDRPATPVPTMAPAPEGVPANASDSTALILPVVLGPRPASPGGETPARVIAEQLIASFPVPFLVVGFFVLFMRLQDRNAWLLALLFAGFIAVAPMLELEGLLPTALRGFALAYKVVFHGLFGALLFQFCAVFPVSSPIDRRLPWLKSLLMGAAAAVSVPLGIATLWTGSTRTIVRFTEWVGATAVTASLSTYFFGGSALALASLVWNGLYAPTPEARRRTRVMVWGTVAGVLPYFLLQVVAVSTRNEPYAFPFWAWAPCVLATLLLPLSFAYAVVKHRVLEIPLLLKRGARYLMVQRGFTLLIIVASAALTLLFAGWSSDLLVAHTDLGGSPGIALGAAFGTLMVWAGTRVRTRVTQRIDRAFFRSAYDARQILQSLAERTSAAGTREELGTLLARHIREALHPSRLAIYLEARDGSLLAVQGAWPGDPERIEPAPPSSHAPARPPLDGLPEAECRCSDATRAWPASSFWGSGCPRSLTRARTGACCHRSPGRRRWHWRTSGSPSRSPSAWRPSGA